MKIFLYLAAALNFALGNAVIGLLCGCVAIGLDLGDAAYPSAEEGDEE